jgi:hypothetical protein
VAFRLSIAQIYLSIPDIAQTWTALELPQEVLVGMLDNAAFLGDSATGGVRTTFATNLLN